MKEVASRFIVLEGLDGSGKTTAGRLLADQLRKFLGNKIQVTCEPNENYCGGDYIRAVLEKRITQFSYETLAYAFAANRKDHGDRLIQPWLDKEPGNIVISDRYYLSSLVYQSSDKLSMEEVNWLNQYAMQPDVIFFLSVTPEVCYERMGARGKPEELFEANFVQTREKYHQAIEFLRNNRQEKIVEIDARGTVTEVVQLLADQMSELFEELNNFGRWVADAGK